MKRLFLLILIATTSQVFASEPVIEHVAVTRTGADTFNFAVTIRHDDTGWDHYADGWRILGMDGAELGMRVLAHPHQNEQPFTRSLHDVAIPAGTTQVQIQARDLPGGWNSGATVVDLP